MGLSSGGLIIGRIFASEIWRAYFREGLFLLFYYVFYFILFYFYFYFFFRGGAYNWNFTVYDFHIFTLSSSSFTGILCIHTMTTLSWLVSSSGKSAAPVLQRSWVQICNC